MHASHFESEYILGRKLSFYCKAQGLPRPRITWLKDGIELYEHPFFQVGLLLLDDSNQIVLYYPQICYRSMSITWVKIRSHRKWKLIRLLNETRVTMNVRRIINMPSTNEDFVPTTRLTFINSPVDIVRNMSAKSLTFFKVALLHFMVLAFSVII